MAVIIVLSGGGLAAIIGVIALLAVVASGHAVGIIAALVTLLYWVIGVFGGAAILGGLAWFFSRDYRRKRQEAARAYQEQRRIDYERYREDELVGRARRRAIYDAIYQRELSEAHRRFNPYIEESTTYTAEVIKRNDGT